MPDLAVIVPTRGRPENIRKVIAAWDFTNAWDSADLVLAVDADDPEIQGYADIQEETRNPDTGEPVIHLTYSDHWVPMVHKLDATAVKLAGRYFALGFAGDDHLPQTIGWAARYLTVLRELGTGMVYGDDGYQGRKLSTEWAVTSDAVRALGRMVPADVEHMYCDNAMMDLFGGAGALKHLPEVRIEHMHPVAGKAETDEQYQRVNHRDQFSKDRRAYEDWRALQAGPDTVMVRNLRKGRPDVSTEPTPRVPRATRIVGSGPRRVERRTPQRSGPTSDRRSRQAQQVREDRGDRTPRHFRNVRAATPEDIMITLADFANQVPADQEIVELGVFCGRTALQMAWGASLGNGAHVTAIDPWDLPGNVYSPPFTDADSRTWAHHWVQTLGYSDKITLVHGFSHEVPWAGPPVGLLYVDGDHTKEGAKRDMVVWSERLAPGAIIAVDDYGHPDWPGVGEAVDELVAEGVLEPIEIFHDRLAVTRLSATPGCVCDVCKLGDVGDCDHEIHGKGPVTAITSEGVSPSPVPAYQATESSVIQPANQGVDNAVSIQEPGLRVLVSAGELEGVAEGTEITELNTVQLRALARSREIVLGTRKDKRAEMLQALTDGR